MRWASETFSDEKKRKNAPLRARWLRECEWHRWFAWRPVRVGNGTELFEFDCKETAWLCFVERRLDASDRRSQPNWFEWGLRDFVYRMTPAQRISEQPKGKT